MTKQTFIAFDTIRTSEAEYYWASRDQNGVVRFHTSKAAALRAPGWQMTSTRIATPDEIKADRAAKAAVKAAKAERDAEFDRAFAALGGN